jgi:hypothetical protein
VDFCRHRRRGRLDCRSRSGLRGVSGCSGGSRGRRCDGSRAIRCAPLHPLSERYVADASYTTLWYIADLVDAAGGFVCSPLCECTCLSSSACSIRPRTNVRCRTPGILRRPGFMSHIVAYNYRPIRGHQSLQRDRTRRAFGGFSRSAVHAAVATDPRTAGPNWHVFHSKIRFVTFLYNQSRGTTFCNVNIG